MRKFAVLLVLCLLGGNAFAMCRYSGLTSETMAASAAGSGSVRLLPDANGYEYPWEWSGTTTNCSASSTVWVADTETKTYRKVVNCTSCPSGYNLAKAKATYGKCIYEFNICDRCTTPTTAPTHGPYLGYYGPGSNCSTYETRYVVTDDGDDSYYEVRSCTSCNSGYHMFTDTADSGECSTSFVACERCGGGKYFDYSQVSTAGYCYDCAKGTYNWAYEATSCETCPTIQGMSTTTSGTGATNVDECCITSGTTTTDSTGTYTIDPICCVED